MTLTQAIERARAMIRPRPEDEALDLNSAIAEVQRLVAADDYGPEPDLEEAIRQVREILEQERGQSRDLDTYLPELIQAQPQYDEALQSLLNAYVRSQCDLHALIGAVALRSMRNPEGIFTTEMSRELQVR